MMPLAFYGIVLYSYCTVDGPNKKALLTFSGGNYGKAFATVVNKRGIESTVVMPTSVPVDRVELIRSLGSNVVQYDTSVLRSKLKERIDAGNEIYLDPFDDIDLIQGYASCALEILDVSQKNIN